MARSLAAIVAAPSVPRRHSQGERSSRSLRDAGRLTAEERAELLGIEEELGPVQRPRTVAECPAGPCPFYSCRHHLGLEVTRFGYAKIVFPDRDVDELAESCSLRAAENAAERAAENGPLPYEAIGKLLNVSMERARQLTEAALTKIGPQMAAHLRDAAPDGSPTKRGKNTTWAI